MAETFLEGMKRSLEFIEEDAVRLRKMGPRMEKYLPEMSEIGYRHIAHHPIPHRVFAGKQSRVDRFQKVLVDWGRGLFGGIYDEAYAGDRCRIGGWCARAGLEQKYIIGAMSVVRAFLIQRLAEEFPVANQRRRKERSLSKILDLDLSLMCEFYIYATSERFRLRSARLERANDNLIKAGQAKDEMLAETAHELRTPLTSILGFAKLILDGMCQNQAEERELLRDIFSSGQHLLGLANDILDLGSIESGRIELNLEPVSVRQVLDSTLLLVGVQVAAKSLAVHDETRNQELPPVRADEVRLRQVLLNLLANAVKFTEKGSIALRAIPIASAGAVAAKGASLDAGAVAAKGASLDAGAVGVKGAGLDAGVGCSGPPIASVPLPASRENGRPPKSVRYLRLEVEDTGIGIPSEKRQAVFQHFVQLDAARTGRQGSSGLGLAITRKLVEMMGGEVGVDASPSGGARVWFTLPLADTEPAPV